MDLEATILAVASPPGRSVRGIIRISGPRAFDLLAPHLRTDALYARPPEAASDEAQLRSPDPDAAIAEKDAGHATQSARFPRAPHRTTLTLPPLPPFSILAFTFPGPRSYTGEDSIELQMPGNPTLMQRVISALIASGTDRGIPIRRAEAGEFTARAFFNGRLSLTQAEGVAATIAAQSDAELRASRMLTSNRLGILAHDLADRLAAALALVEAGIDFTDQEDVVAISPGELHERLKSLCEHIEAHLRRAVGTEQLQAIPWVVLAGEPNAGKSALFNALLGHERAVVSAIAGTTRDVLAEPLTIETGQGRAEVMLIDLAGHDETDFSAMNRLMQEAARYAKDRAELVLRCVPVDQPAPASLQIHELLVRTKRDLLLASDSAGEPNKGATVCVSAITGQGLEVLRAKIARTLSSRAVSLAADALALQPRHEAALRAALEHLQQARALVEPTKNEHALRDAELIAAAMRSSLDDLAGLAGDITPDDILGRVFATFCVGK